MATPFSELIKADRPAIGTILSTVSTEVAEVLAASGFDWVFIDMEQGPLDFAGLQRVLQTIQPQVAGVVRVPENADVWTKRALDAGSDGVIVPLVNSADEAR